MGHNCRTLWPGLTHIMSCTSSFLKSCSKFHLYDLKTLGEVWDTTFHQPPNRPSADSSIRIPLPPISTVGGIKPDWFSLVMKPCQLVMLKRTGQGNQCVTVSVVTLYDSGWSWSSVKPLITDKSPDNGFT